eukprot:UN01235
MYEYGQRRDWSQYGSRSYFSAHVLSKYTRKKQMELLTLVDFHENRIGFEQFHSNIRKLKDKYPEQEFDESYWHPAYVAGLIDSDGNINLYYPSSKHKNPVLRVN